MHGRSRWKKDCLEGLLFAGATVGLYNLPPNVIETYYSNGVFPYIARAEGFAGDLVPFSIFDGFVIGGTAYLAYCFGRFAVRKSKVLFDKCKKKPVALESRLEAVSGDENLEQPAYFPQNPSRFQRFKTYLSEKLVSYCGVFKRLSKYALVLTLLGGLNSARVPVAEKAGLSQSNVDIQLEQLVERINSKKQAVGDFVFAVDVMNPDFIASVNKSVDDAYLLLNKSAVHGPSKIKTGIMLPPLIGGVSLLSFESSIRLQHNFFPFWVVGHELAHTKGYMVEKDAEALNYVACLNSGNPVLEYCSMLQLFLLSSVHLSRENPALVKYAFGRLAESVKKDFDFLEEVPEYSKIAVIISDFFQKVRGQKSSFNAYVTEVVPVLWAIDDAYRKGCPSVRIQE